MRRYILTGTPGAGKTSLLHGLADLGLPVVEEAATAVIAQAQARGEDEPWTRASFLDDIVGMQKARQLAAPATGPVQVYDRSPICTHALARYLGRPIPPSLTAEIERITAEHIYERRVFFVRNLGFCEPTSARRISFEESLEFERVHEESYRAFGYELLDVPAAALADRVQAVRSAMGPPGPEDPAPGVLTMDRP
ncbi:AAA family ATPase [Streptomyces sp. NBC_00028]|uniref:ATP/GTP-binding protein n=1 Tax=Streptomyces sp. NBC_00028 TaxID=2975624 RepID=UPI00324ACD9E